jgi:hypothetical protein
MINVLTLYFSRIVSYMIKQSLPAVSILDASSIDEFKKAEKVVVVAYLESSDKSSNETYTAVANEYRDKFLFGASHDKKLAEADGVKQPAIVLYKQFDEGKSTFTDKFENEAIGKFISTASTPLVGEVGPETYADYMAVSTTSLRLYARLYSHDCANGLTHSRPAFRLPMSLPRLLRSELSLQTCCGQWLRSTGVPFRLPPLMLRLTVRTLAT